MQVPGTSWRNVSKWNALVEAPALSPEDYAAVHPMIVKDICEHFRYEDADGSRIAMRPQDFMIDTPSFEDMRALFLAMQRKMGGSDMHEKTHANRDIVEKELKRATWPKGKPPNIEPW
jgi:hypothetical protein